MFVQKDLVAASSTPLILSILKEQDSYGYAIIKKVRELSHGRLEWTEGMLYPVLQTGRVVLARIRDRPEAEVLPHHRNRP